MIINPQTTLFLNALFTCFLLCLAGITMAQPVANFNYNFNGTPATVCVPTSVQLTSTSTGDIVQYSWEVEDTFFSDAPNPSLDFSIGSSYIVCLSVTDTAGLIDEFCQTIEVWSAPSANFTASPSNICFAPLEVQFTPDNASSTGLNYQWFFGDGTSSNSPAPIHQYVESGNFDVTLIITDDETGCSSSLLQNDLIQIGGVSAQFDFQVINNGNCNDTEVSFMYPNAGDITSLEWDFGDGTTSSTINPSHSYTEAGCFTPSLRVTTVEGCTNTFSATDCINSNGSNPVSYSTQGDLIACEATNGLEVQFFSNAPNAVELLWNFGGLGNSNELNPTFVFDQFGTFPVSLTVFFADGCGTSVVDTSIVIQPIELSFEADMTSGCEGLEVQFQNTSNIPYPISELEWDFEIETSNLDKPTTTFNESGTYGIGLTVSTESGCEAELVLEEYIQIGAPPTADFTVNIQETCGDKAIFFKNDSSPNATQFFWDLGDGTTSVEENPIHFYVDTGYMDITLIVIDNGCADTIIKEDFIHIIPPIALFEVEKECHSKTVAFQNNSIAAETYLWDFGDGMTSVEENPIHTYEINDTFTVTLNVFSTDSICEDDIEIVVPVTSPSTNFLLENDTPICINDTITVSNFSKNGLTYEWLFDDNNIIGIAEDSLNENIQYLFPVAGVYTDFGLIVRDELCADTLVITDTVFVSTILADFESEIVSACFPIKVEFDNLSTAEYGQIISYFWDFGDGNTSLEAKPKHSYEESGTYAISLTIKNEWGCSATITKFSDVEIELLNPTFEVTQNDCASIELHATNTTTSNNGLTYFWDFGDGFTSTDADASHIYETPDTYTACLTVDNGECEATYCQDLQVFLPQADFVVDNVYSPCPSEPLTANFVDISIGATAWEWAFGDGIGTSNLANPTYIYTQSGQYTVCLIATNQFGCKDTLCQENLIQIDGPNASVLAFNNEGCADLLTTFTVTSEGAINYIFDFGDGETFTGEGNLNSDELSHLYTTPGTYYPNLTLVDENGCEVVFSSEVPIIVEGMNLDFSSTNNVFCESNIQTINFFSIVDNQADIVTVQWTFAGSNTPNSSELNPENVLYASAGIYPVSLEITTTECTNRIMKDSFVIIETSPTATFEVSSESICANELTEFQNTSPNQENLDFQWFVNENPLQTTTDFAYTFPSAGTYEVSLEASGASGCSSIFKDTIFIFQGITVDLESEILLCQQENTLLTPFISAPNEVLYQWSPAENLDCEFCPEPVASPSESTTYYLSALTSDGCTATDSIHIIVSPTPPPSIDLTEDTAICFGESLSLLATSDQSNVNFTWTNPTNLSCSDCPNPIANPTESTMYYASVFNADGCTNMDSVWLEVWQDTEIILGDDISLCEGNTTVLEVLSGDNPIWENQSSLSCTNCPNPTANPSQNTNYIVTVISENGCSLTDTLTVNVVEAIEVTAGQNQVVCLGDSIVLQADYEGEVIWTNNGNLVGINEAAIVVYPTENTTYNLSVLNNNCPSTAQIEVEVFENSELWVSDEFICAGEQVQLSASGYAIDFEWLPSAYLSDWTSPNPIANPPETTTFTLIGTAGTCPPDTAQVTVEVQGNPVIQTDQFIPFSSGSEIALQTTIEGDGDYTYAWSNDGSLSCTDCPNPVATPDSTSMYNLLVTDANGCSSSIAIQVSEIIACAENSIVVPSAFTPNQDGENDVFYIRGTAEVALFQVYNRWGEKVFETTNPNLGWDGSYKGQILNRDVFVYYVEAVCAVDGRMLIQTGDVTLIR